MILALISPPKGSKHVIRIKKGVDTTNLTCNELIMKIMQSLFKGSYCRNPTLAKCGGEAQHLEKVRIWSPPGLLNVQSSTAEPKTPCIGVFFGVIEKVLKRTYRKWPCIDHLDIYSPSYGQKKGRESNWHFDSR